MHQLCTVSSINPPAVKRTHYPFLKSNRMISFLMTYLMILGLIGSNPSIVFGQEQQRDEPMEMSVVVVNPSSTKTQSVPIKMYLPMEVTPDAILSLGGLEVEYDSEKSMYYLYKDEVILKPSETKTFNVEIKDVWKVPQGRLDSLSAQSNSIIARLVGSEFYDSAVLLGEAIDGALNTIAVTQNDEAVSRRTHIGIFRNNQKIVTQVKEDVERLEKQLDIVHSLPKPDVLEQASLKTDSPTESTSWMIIFIIMLFISMLAGVFFFTWQTQANSTKTQIAKDRDSAFPEREKASGKDE